MGYRHYFYIAEKAKLEEVKDFSEQQMKEKYPKAFDDDCNDEEYFSMHCFLDEIGAKEVYEFGKLYGDNVIDEMLKGSRHILLHEDFKNYYDENDYEVVTPDAIVSAIKDMKDKIFNYFSKLQNESKEKIDMAIRNKIMQYKLTDLGVVTLGSKYGLSNSWDYEYEQFNLAFLYKTIDFDKYALILTGY